MTLILACISRRFAIQVSDKCISELIGGRLVRTLDDNRNKGVLWCNRMGFAYTGLAELEKKPTDVWLAHLISEASQAGEHVFHAIAQRATETFASIRLPPDMKAHAFVGTGWQSDPNTMELQPIILAISNAIDSAGHWTGITTDNFTVQGWSLKSTTPCLLQTFGAGVSDDEVVETSRLLRRREKRLCHPRAQVAALQRCLSRVAARNITVSQSHLGMVLPRSGVTSAATGLWSPPGWPNEVDTPIFFTSTVPRAKPTFTHPCFTCDGELVTNSRVTLHQPPDGIDPVASPVESA